MSINRFNLTCPLSRFVRSLRSAQTAPIRFAERAAQVKRMLAVKGDKDDCREN